MWIGYDGLGTSAASPGCSSTHIRWLKPSLAPIVEITSVSGSSIDAEPALVERGDGLAQLGDAPARGVAVVARVVRRLGQLLDGDVRRGEVRVAEAEVHHVRPARRASTFSPSMIVKTYGGRPGMRRNSTGSMVATSRYAVRRALTPITRG